LRIKANTPLMRHRFPYTSALISASYPFSQTPAKHCKTTDTG